MASEWWSLRVKDSQYILKYIFAGQWNFAQNLFEGSFMKQKYKDTVLKCFMKQDTLKIACGALLFKGLENFIIDYGGFFFCSKIEHILLPLANFLISIFNFHEP